MRSTAAASRASCATSTAGRSASSTTATSGGETRRSPTRRCARPAWCASTTGCCRRSRTPSSSKPRASSATSWRATRPTPAPARGRPRHEGQTLRPPPLPVRRSRRPHPRTKPPVPGQCPVQRRLLIDVPTARNERSPLLSARRPLRPSTRFGGGRALRAGGRQLSLLLLLSSTSTSIWWGPRASRGGEAAQPSSAPLLDEHLDLVGAARSRTIRAWGVVPSVRRRGGCRGSFRAVGRARRPPGGSGPTV